MAMLRRLAVGPASREDLMAAGMPVVPIGVAVRKRRRIRDRRRERRGCLSMRREPELDTEALSGARRKCAESIIVLKKRGTVSVGELGIYTLTEKGRRRLAWHIARKRHVQCVEIKT